MTVSTSAQENGSKASTAPSFGTKAPRAAQTLSDRLTPLLLRAGLIAGITPTSIRRGSRQRYLDIASDAQDGSDAE